MLNFIFDLIQEAIDAVARPNLYATTDYLTWHGH